jgi:hypothetical protein
VAVGGGEDAASLASWLGEHRGYLRGLSEQPSLFALFGGSARFVSTDQLVELGLMRSSAQLDAVRGADAAV